MLTSGTPATAYLVRRGAWPASRELPASVRWLPLRDVPTSTMRRALDTITEPEALAGTGRCSWRSTHPAATGT